MNITSKLGTKLNYYLVNFVYQYIIMIFINIFEDENISLGKQFYFYIGRTVT